MHTTRVLTVAGCMAVCVLSSACRDSDRGDAAAADTVPVGENLTQTAAMLAPVRAVSVAETEFSALAAERAEREVVKRYAGVVAADHRAVVGVLDSVAQSAGLKYAPTGAVRELEEGVRVAHAGLDNLEGYEFDLAFIRAEVESHRQLVDRLDQELIPGVGAEEQRRMLLQEVRAMADAHLTRARQILATLLETAPARASPRPPAAPRDTGARRVRPDTLRHDAMPSW